MAQKQDRVGGNADYAELRHLQVELKEVVEWFALGVQLEIPTHELEAIRIDHMTVKDCRLYMLIAWSQLEQPTWTKLIKALNNIGKTHLAENIAKKHGMRIYKKPRKSEVEPMDETEQGLLHGSSRQVVASPEPQTEANLGSFGMAFGHRLETDAEQSQDVRNGLASYPLLREPGSEASNGQDPNSQLVKVKDIEYVDPDPFGYGYYGNVRKVKYKGMICAAKYFYPREGMREKVKKEADILSKLQRFEHRNVVQYIGGNTTIAQPVLIMELLQTNLRNYLKENPAEFILISAILGLLHNVSKGLEYLHEQNVIHRDLTVNNVLLDDNGVAKVADFGNSRVIEFDSPIDIATMTVQPGTRLYCAPETISTVGCPRGPRYNNKVDIFSFGQLSAVVVTQKFPEDIDPGNIKSVPDLRQIYMCDVEKKLWGHPFLGLIKSCLSTDRDIRPSASDLQTKLGELYDEEESQIMEMVSDSEDSLHIR